MILPIGNCSICKALDTILQDKENNTYKKNTTTTPNQQINKQNIYLECFFILELLFFFMNIISIQSEEK